uniref:HDC16556 n=1 Tax=Drosophila melanogaster TaxID=7227 RepID=Q6IIY6_DROME|nr:TPA_inf: HDC16556 [Drosophila melanogaster]
MLLFFQKKVLGSQSGRTETRDLGSEIWELESAYVSLAQSSYGATATSDSSECSGFYLIFYWRVALEASLCDRKPSVMGLKIHILCPANHPQLELWVNCSDA